MDGRGACRRLRLVDPPHPVTALASVPGSGSTWLRHLLHQTTGKRRPLMTDRSKTPFRSLTGDRHCSVVRPVPDIAL
ncbi:hypothetical protein C0Q70_08584 [Pomacea canaliculata]|uniref:Sulfotransferase domain-containing protein n=1 Tax=Pomacea canaliculata TaxID=400727 RepID=A0A2T7PI88_POMCA|nr:hypothetical protein C0Q70_08584 [Pomacea canaliculata]